MAAAARNRQKSSKRESERERHKTTTATATRAVGTRAADLLQLASNGYNLIQSLSGVKWPSKKERKRERPRNEKLDEDVVVSMGELLCCAGHWSKVRECV